MASSNWRRLRSAPQQHQAAPLQIKTNQHAVQAHERKIEHPASPLPNTSTTLPCASRRRIIPIARSRSSVSPIAVSSLGGFRTPAAEHPRRFSSGRHPKPFTIADLASPLVLSRLGGSQHHYIGGPSIFPSKPARQSIGACSRDALERASIVYAHHRARRQKRKQSHKPRSFADD